MGGPFAWPIPVLKYIKCSRPGLTSPLQIDAHQHHRSCEA